FQFVGVEEGSYQIHIGINYEQISGLTYAFRLNDWVEVKSGQHLQLEVPLSPLMEVKAPVNYEEVKGPDIRFAWEPVEGAAYYRLQFALHIDNGSYGSMLSAKISEPELQLPLEQLY